MPTLKHEYPVVVEWKGGRDGAGAIAPQISEFEIPIAVPPEFQGPGGATNPEELLTSAIAACYTITFGIVAANRKLPVLDVRTEAVGEVDQNGASFVYSRIVIRPTIKVEPNSSPDHMKAVEDMAHKADSYCIVTNAVRGKVEVVVEPTIIPG